MVTVPDLTHRLFCSLSSRAEHCIAAVCLAAFSGFLNIDVLFAQHVTVQGIISVRSSGQRLEGANVALQSIPDGQSRGTATDREGYYRISGIPGGEYQLQVSYIGYLTYTDTLVLGDERLVTRSISLVRSQEELDELVVAQEGGSGRLEGGMQRIRQVDLGRVPTPAAGGDLANYLQTLPGVVAAGDRGGQLFVRGGTPSQNLVLIDGTLVYRPFHIVGFYSVFPEDLVSSADFHAGGFGARYHGRISSVLDVQMRDGNREQVHGAVTLSPFQGGIRIEGPIEEGKTALLGSFRSSLIEQTSPDLLGKQQPLKFGSQFIKLSTWGNNTRCSVMGLHTYDRGRLDPDIKESDSFSWTNIASGGRCLVIPEESPGIVEISTGLSHVSNSAGQPGEPERKATSSRFYIDLNLTRFLEDIRFDFGFFTRMNWFNYNLQEQYEIPRNERDMLLGLGGFVDLGIPLGSRVQMHPGVVVTFYPFSYDPGFEPRLRFNWRPWGRDAEQLSAAIGIYRQILAGISDDRDAGSPFTAWIPEPRDGAQMEALHTLLGWHQQLGGGFQYSVEGYYKSLKDLPVSIWSTIARFTTELARADGNVYGVDTRLEYIRNIVYAYIGYGFSWTRYYSAQDNFGLWFGEPVQGYHPLHDRRHQISALFSIDIGSFTTSLQWQYGSGQPYTRHMGFDELINLESLPDVRQIYGTRRILLEKPYLGRLPTFHRFDASVQRSFKLSVADVTLKAGAVNIYDRANLFYYDVYTQRRIDQLPFFPYISINMETN